MTFGRSGTRAAPPPLLVGGEGDAEGPDARILLPTHANAPTRPPSDVIRDFGGETMGTTWSVRCIAPVDVDSAGLEAAVRQELDAVVALFSHWDPRSELSRLNHAPPGFWAVSQSFWDGLNACMDLADETNGAVDPTLGALVDLWGFGPPGARQGWPTEDEITAALAVSGWGRLRLNRDARAVQQMGGLRLDLSSFAKGLAVDRVSDRLAAEGATHHLVEIGGELRGRGLKPDGYPWWTKIDLGPLAPGPRTVAGLFDLAVATSGDWIRGFDSDGRRFGHTLDGAAGRPVANGVAACCVFADTALKADALSTALIVMGPFEAMAYAEANDIAALMVVRDGETVREVLSPALTAMTEVGA